MTSVGWVSSVWNLGSYLTKLDGNCGITWQRNTWQNYRFTVKGNAIIKVYI